MPGNAPFFSVVIPTYNAWNTLGETLDSVFAQTFHNLEVVAVDNCSTDGTAELLMNRADPRLSVVRVHNGGVIAYSRNVGLRQ